MIENIGCYIDFDESTIPQHTIIYGYVGSEAQKYAEIYDRNFIGKELNISGICGAEGDNLIWKLDSTGLLTISGVGKMCDYDLLAPWSDYSNNIISLVVEDGVTSIGRNAFKWCYELTTVNLPNSIRSIEEQAFDDCDKLTSINLPDGLTTIGNFAFSDCEELTSITIPDSITSIGNNAFSWCESLASITIPQSVTSIGGQAFSDTQWIITQQEENPLVVINGILIDGRTCEGKVIIPDYVKIIGADAFSDCTSLTTVVIPDSVISIEECAFLGCSELSSIIISDSVEHIGQRAFYECSSLMNIDFSNNIKSIGPYAFYYTPWLKAQQELDSLVIVNGILIDGTTCKKNVEIPDNVKIIVQHAFDDCDTLNSITIPESVAVIESYAFNNCDYLRRVNILEGITSISNGAFSNCMRLGLITIPDSVTSIGNNAFSSCESLSSITIPDSVMSIGKYAFSNCTNLTSITIPSSVTSIGEGAFIECDSLKNIPVEENNEFYKEIDGVLFSKDGSSIICFPAGKTYSTYTIPNGVMNIRNDAFRGCINLSSITIPSSVISLGNSVFLGCYNLNSIIILNSELAIKDNESGLPSDVTIYGYEGSTAQAYATKYKRKFVSLDESPVTTTQPTTTPTTTTTTTITIEPTIITTITEAPTATSSTTTNKLTTTTHTTTESPTTTTTSTTVTTTNSSVTSKPNYSLGDVNNDGMINPCDASIVLKEYSLVQIGGESSLNEIEKAAADTNCDNRIDSMDAILILDYYSYRMSGAKPISLEEFAGLTGGDILEYTGTADNGFTSEQITASAVKPKITLTKNVISSDECKNIQSVDLIVENVAAKWSSAGLHLYYDSRLTPAFNRKGEIDYTIGEATAYLSLTPVVHNESNHSIFFAATCQGNYGLDGVLSTFKFYIPEDAQPGDVYYFDLKYVEGDVFSNVNNDNESKLMQAYLFTQGIYNKEYNNNFIAEANDIEKCSTLADIDKSYDGYIAIADEEKIITTTSMTTSTTTSTTSTTTTTITTTTLTTTSTTSTTTTSTTTLTTTTTMTTNTTTEALVTTTTSCIETNSVAIVLNNTTATEGENVSIFIDIENNPGVSNAEFDVAFDSECLKFIDAQSGDAMADTEFSCDISEDGTLHISYTGEGKDNGTMAVLNFNVLKTPEDSKESVTIVDDSTKITDLYGDNVEIEVIYNESTESNAGDVNNDSEIDLKDVVLIRRFIAGGWDVELDPEDADVNNDNEVDLKDVVLIRRYIAGGWDVELA